MKFCCNCLIVFILAIIAGQLSAQESTSGPTYPNGTPILKIFANVHTGLTDANRSRAFEIRRAYIGYLYNFDPHFSTELKLDIGSPEEISEYARLRRYAYFKTAALYWEKDRWTIRAGIIDTEHYRRQEKYWKHRYLLKSFQDLHRFGPKADLGTTVIFRAVDWLELDASLLNGEGYTNLQQDNSFKTSFGVNLYPIERVLLRVYYDYMNQEVLQSTLSTFAAYRHNQLTGGIEYNRKNNRDFRINHNQDGFSAYLSFDLNERYEVFGRYDRLSSNIPAEYNKPWNLQSDGSALIGGIQYTPIDHVKIALNYRDWVPYAANMGNERFIFLNLEIAL